MAKSTGTYETMIVISTSLGEDGIKATADKFKGMIESAGTMTEVTEWGKRRMAYPINDEMEGFYIIFSFTCPPDFPAELDRVLKITDGILRSLIIAQA